MTIKKALIIEGVYLHAEDAPELDDIQVYVSNDTVDITTHHKNTISLDFEELDAINALVAEARKPRIAPSFHINLSANTREFVNASLSTIAAQRVLGTAVRESERRAVEGARNPAPTWPPDWSTIPVGFDHAAVDADGKGWAYKTKPITLSFMWAGGWLDPVKDLGHVTLPQGMTWQDTYCQRPFVKPADDLAFLGLSWADVPSKYICVAVDKNGEVWAYSDIPETFEYSQNWATHVSSKKLAKREPGTFGDWKESLRIRPTAMKQILGIDWADVPKHLNFVATDYDGRVFGYTQRPGRYSSAGSVWHGAGWVKLTQIALSPNLSWRNTLFVRPGYTEPQS